MDRKVFEKIKPIEFETKLERLPIIVGTFFEEVLNETGIYLNSPFLFGFETLLKLEYQAEQCPDLPQQDEIQKYIDILRSPETGFSKFEEVLSRNFSDFQMLVKALAIDSISLLSDTKYGTEEYTKPDFSIPMQEVMTMMESTPNVLDVIYFRLGKIFEYFAMHGDDSALDPRLNRANQEHAKFNFCMNLGRVITNYIVDRS